VAYLGRDRLFHHEEREEHEVFVGAGFKPAPTSIFVSFVTFVVKGVSTRKLIEATEEGRRS
jgi:hypothetical protein